MAPSEGVNSGEAAPSSPVSLARPWAGLLSRLKRLCACGVPLKVQDGTSQAAAPAACLRARPPSRKSGGGNGGRQADVAVAAAAAASSATMDSPAGLNNSLMLSIRVGVPPMARESDATLACGDGHNQLLESKHEQHPALLTTLTFGLQHQQTTATQTGSVASQRMSPCHLSSQPNNPGSHPGGYGDLVDLAAIASLQQYCHSSYVINAPTLMPPSVTGGGSGANGLAASPSQSGSVQPGTYIDLPKISDSPGPTSPLILAPSPTRGRRALSQPPPVTAAPAASATGGGAAAAVILPVLASSPASQGLMPSSSIIGHASRSGIPEALPESQRLPDGHVAAAAAGASSAADAAAAAAFGSLRLVSAQALQAHLSPMSLPRPWSGDVYAMSGPGHGYAGRTLAGAPSAPLPSLQQPLSHPAPPALAPEDSSLRSQLSQQPQQQQQQLPRRVALSAQHVARRPRHGASEAFGSVPSPFVTSSGVPAPTPAPYGPGDPSSDPQRYHSLSGFLGGYGTGHVCGNGGGGGGSVYGYMDGPEVLTDGRSTALSVHVPRARSPPLGSFQYGGTSIAVANAAMLATLARAGAPYGNVATSYGASPVPPSPPRSSVGFVVPSRVSVSGAGSVLSLPIDTVCLHEVIAPKTGLLPPQTALEMSQQAPALDLWAAAAHVSLTGRIAQGAYGVVYRGVWHGCACAVKLMLAASTDSLSAQLTEVFLCKALSCHPNIVQTFDCNVWRITSDTLQAVQSFCGFGGGAAAAAAGPYGAFGAGAAAAAAAAAAFGPGGPLTQAPDSLLPAAAGALQAVASTWLGATPSLGRSAAPSASSYMAQNGGFAAVTALAPLGSAGPQAQNVLGPGGRCGGGGGGSGLPQDAAAVVRDSLMRQIFPASSTLMAPMRCWDAPQAAPPLLGIYTGGSSGTSPPPAELVLAALPLLHGPGISGAEELRQAPPACQQHLVQQQQLPQEQVEGGKLPPLLCLSPSLSGGGSVSGQLSAPAPPTPHLRCYTAAEGASPLRTQSYAQAPPQLLHPRSQGHAHLHHNTLLSHHASGGGPRGGGSAGNAGATQIARTRGSSGVEPAALPRAPSLTMREQPLCPVAEEAAALENQGAARSPSSLGFMSQPVPPPIAFPSSQALPRVGPAAPPGPSPAYSAGPQPVPPPPPQQEPGQEQEGPQQQGQQQLGAIDDPQPPQGAEQLRQQPQQPLEGSGVQPHGDDVADGAFAIHGSVVAAAAAAAAAAQQFVAAVPVVDARTAAATPFSAVAGAVGPSVLATSASRFPSSNTGVDSTGGRWLSPDVTSRYHCPAAAGTAAAVFPVSAVAAAAAALGNAAGTASAAAGGGLAGLSMGLCSSPISSGVLLPGGTMMAPGSASVSRRLSDRAFGGGGGGYGSSPGPLQTRSAVSVGDESDAMAAMAGARSLAHVLNFLGAREGQLVVVVVMEECDRGSLQQLISKAAAAAAAAAADGAAVTGGGGSPGGALRTLYAPFSGGGRYPPQAALRALALTAKEVALGMAFLHHNNIIHGDLKPGNVLLRSSRQDQRGFVVKISDFGLSRVLHPAGSTTHNLLATLASSGGDTDGAGSDGGGDGEVLGSTLDGTVPYLAPELINNGQRSKASDVWAYGVLLWQLVTGTRPYDGLTQWQIMVAVSAGEQLLEWPPATHPALVHLGRACLAVSPRDRPGFAQAVRRLQALEAELRSEMQPR